MYNCLYTSLVYLCFFSSGVYLYSRTLMYVKRHEQFEIGCGAILNTIYYHSTAPRLLHSYHVIYLLTSFNQCCTVCV